MLAIIPARAGSVGVPAKNLRPIAGVPLVLHTANLLRPLVDPVTGPITRLVISTNDPTVEALARLHGLETHPRPTDLATAHSTVQEVAWYVARNLSWEGPVGVFQPTSPTLTTETIADALAQFLDPTCDWDSLASVVPDTGLLHDAKGAPLFAGYTNRQDTSPLWRRTGGIQLARSMPAPGGSDVHAPLVGGVHHLYELPADEALDIDTIGDLTLARRAAASTRTIFFYTDASHTIGSGHIRRCYQLAQELDHYTVAFVVPTSTPEWAVDLLAPYPVLNPPTAAPDLAIIDALDTTTEFVADLKAKGAAVITLEDLGPGAALADFTVNELYNYGHLTGPRYAVLRPEFAALPPYTVTNTPPAAQTVLVSFGGTDPSHLTTRVARALLDTKVSVRVIPPAAYAKEDLYTLKGGPWVTVTNPVMAAEMHHADLLVTSCGRTVHEAAAVGIPTITIAANERETRHAHCPGPIHLGLGLTLDDATITTTATRLLASPAQRSEISNTMRAAVDGKGARRIAHLAEGLLEGL